MKLLFTLLFVLFYSLQLAAQDGTLDVTYGTGGRAYSIPPGLNQSLSKTVVQPDGKVIIAGRATNCCGYDFSVARFTANGRPDSTFDEDGYVVTEFTPGAWDIITTVAVQPDGKIIAGGYSNNRYALARYHVDGTLDNSFNGNGKIVSAASISSEIYDILVMSDGKILAGGASSAPGGNFDFALLRYLPDGRPDLTFDTDGMATTPVGPYSDIVYSLALQADGKIIAAGATYNSLKNDFGIVRYNADGSPDHTFNGNGKNVIDFSGDDKAYSAAIQPDGRIVVAGVSDFTMAIARVLSNGQPDNTFHLTGRMVTGFGSSFDQLYSVLIQSDGKILAGGISFNGANSDYALMRFNTDGSFDMGFGTAGKLRLDMGADEAYPTLAGWGDKVLMGGYSSNRLAVARLNNSSSIFVLPLRLLSFSATGSGQAIRMAWRTATEVPLSHFIIEHSTDGRNFSVAGTIQVNNNNSREQSHAFEYGQPRAGMHYFRLKIVDKTGRYSYSNVLAVNLGNSMADLILLQNPVQHTLRVQVLADGHSALRITDRTGSIIRQLDLLSTGINAFAFDVAALPAGAYYLIFTNRNGKHSKTFIKN